ncbi:response regulator transcription factor [Lichenibacterium minor]|uniref:Response regulator transcription factor n=1 Tax=Lichenibacterium minor TaxID=2316528 RepID=A0A4Q2U2H1_9HYPH|nr:response regulator [Lichenibacterium minor]RYC29051.1 response regulator transcription factor [Lichenibacterium minor]
MHEPSLREMVLVVDDAAETLTLLTDALDEAGMTAMVALDGTSALRVAKRLPPDLILLDAVMPGIDGFETCRRLKAEPSLGDVPVIFMTGLSETEHIVRGLEAGGVDYVTKPLAVEELVARIRVHLATARTARSARAALDASGRHLMAVDGAGRVLWLTPRAQALVSADGAARVLPEDLRDWLATAIGPQAVAGLADGRRDAVSLSLAAAGPVTVCWVGRIGADEFLLRLMPEEPDDLPPDLFQPYRLTGRELQVLGWIAKGKSNRDAAEILGLSTRTVDKHLEGIYAKLGVENRTAAAALVLTLLGRAAG